GGLGLGLSIGRTLVEAHGGMLVATSEGRSKGAVFTMLLPTQAPEAGVVESKEKVPDKVTRHEGLRILLVEDHPDTAKIMARLLGRHGYVVKTAESVKTALDVIQANEFD